ncbi:MAG TPA: hypothetical protein VFV31_11145 [Chitinophagaceae bacterium]|nr:hypothetical protein [Chitinophagaceae bacterium]
MIRGFNWIRLVRLLAGGIALYQGIVSYNTILGVIGVLLLIQGIFNLGCPGLSCSAPYKQTTLSNTDEIKFEEVK